MILKNISKREKVYFLITFIVIFLVICYNFFLEPFIGKVTQINEEVLANEIKLKKINKLLLEKEDIFAIYDKYAKGIRIQGLSDEEAVAQFLADVETLARKSSMFINDVKPKPVKNLVEYKRFNFDLELEGSIGNISKFIYELEKSPEAIRIERLQISAKTGKSDVLKADLSIAKLAIP